MQVWKIMVRMAVSPHMRLGCGWAHLPHHGEVRVLVSAPFELVGCYGVSALTRHRGDPQGQQGGTHARVHVRLESDEKTTTT